MGVVGNDNVGVLMEVIKNGPIGLQIDGDENVGISQEMALAICRLKGVKSWDIPRNFTVICCLMY